MLIFGFSLLFSCGAVKRTNKHISDLLESAPVFSQSFAGLAVFDPVEHKMLYVKNADNYFTPASNTKLLTYYTGLMLLGDSVPGLKYFTARDSLIFKGTGDPSLLNPNLSNSGILQFLKNRREKLFYSPPSYQEAHFGPGWSWDDYNSYYSVERTAFPIYGNSVRFIQPSASLLPKTIPAYFQNNLSADSLSTKSSKRVTRNLIANTFSAQSIARDTSFQQEVPFKYSSELFVELLSDTLHKEIEIIKKVPKSFAPARTFFSIPSDSLYKKMLTDSDNFIAEQILLLASDKLSDTLKTSIAIEYMQDHFLKDLPDKPIWVDGSGLSRYNLCTPRSLVKVLEKIKDKVPYEKLFTFLPVGGKTGTLKHYFSADKPYVFAKTGSLSNNYSLSGFLKTKSGKILIFSFMNSNYTVPSSKLKREMERILKMIRETY